MTDYPILFSVPMVRAIREGRKTQTRRVIENRDDGVSTVACDQYGDWHARRCPYGQPGDRLWVKEAYLTRFDGACILYKSDLDPVEAAGIGAMYGGWKSSRYMPQRAARLWLEVSAVRVERLQEISETDAIREGCLDAYGPDFHVGAFRTLWDSLHRERGFGWDINPWVWVITFRVMDGKR